MHTSAMMRSVDWRRAAAVVLLLGYLVPKAVTKTSRKDSATEGKSGFEVLNCSSRRTNLLVSWLMVLLACTDSAGTQTWLMLAS